MNKTMLFLAAAASAVGFVMGRSTSLTGKKKRNGKKKSGLVAGLLKGYAIKQIARRLGKSKKAGR